jgi:two-component system, NarL family, sensor kinase
MMPFFAVLMPVFLLVIAIITYAFLHQKKVIQLRAQLYEEELNRQQAVFDALQEGQEQERTRLAQELHDGVGARLSGIKMYLEHLKANADGNRELVEKIFSGVSETLEEVREISHNLHPLSLDKKGLEQLLREYIEQLNVAGSCHYDLLMDLQGLALDKSVQLHSYRIIEELLSNINKHARATLASVQINVEDGKMEMVVEDNGIGLDKARANSEGIGLRNIHSRVNVCKGMINIDSSGNGTTVIIEVPVNTQT